MKGVLVGLIGFGTVGSGVVKILERRRDLIEKRLGFPLILKRIVDLDLETDRGVAVEASKLTREARDVIDDPDISVVIELIGGFEPAKTFILGALKNKKHVVTANKALLAVHGDEIFRSAYQHGADINFEASVGGGIPIIRSMREGLAANQIISFSGILNGTSNYILTRMQAKGESFGEVLREAQREGYAESDPSMDVDGIDPAHKLAILISLAWGGRVRFEDIPRAGITAVSPLDIQYASDCGYKIKLLATARAEDSQVEAQVCPTMIPLDHPLAAVDGVNNAIFVTGDAVGSTMYYGQGAGQMPTASAVVSDVMELARNVRDKRRGRLSPYSHQRRYVKGVRIKNIGHVMSRWYLRASVVDGPHVLSGITRILERYGVGVTTLERRARDGEETLAVMVLTKPVRGRDMIRAVSQIDELPVIAEKTTVVRVE